MDVDVSVQNEGSIFLLHPQTEDAVEWCSEYLPDDCQMFGGAYVVEHRFVANIVEGMQADGLVVA